MAYNVLVVDDSPVIRKVVKRAMAISGLDLGQVHEASNGLEALRVLDEHWIDLVLTDLNMPEMTGDELIAKMVENRRLEDTPVVVITSDRNERHRIELTQQGVHAYLHKPFRPEVLREVVTGLMDRSRMR